MVLNEEELTVQPRHPKHPGFVDAEGTELNPGDEIVVHNGYYSFHALITRFTPRRVYWRPLKTNEYLGDGRAWVHKADQFTQMHHFYYRGEDIRTMRRIIKLETP